MRRARGPQSEKQREKTKPDSPTVRMMRARRSLRAFQCHALFGRAAAAVPESVAEHAGRDGLLYTWSLARLGRKHL